MSSIVSFVLGMLGATAFAALVYRWKLARLAVGLTLGTIAVLGPLHTFASMSPTFTDNVNSAIGGALVGLLIIELASWIAWGRKLSKP